MVRCRETYIKKVVMYVAVIQVRAMQRKSKGWGELVMVDFEKGKVNEASLRADIKQGTED